MSTAIDEHGWPEGDSEATRSCERTQDGSDTEQPQMHRAAAGGQGLPTLRSSTGCAGTPATLTADRRDTHEWLGFVMVRPGIEP